MALALKKTIVVVGEVENLCQRLPEVTDRRGLGCRANPPAG